MNPILNFLYLSSGVGWTTLYQCWSSQFINYVLRVDAVVLILNCVKKIGVWLDPNRTFEI
jgi:hypothetical protein